MFATASKPPWQRSFNEGSDLGQRGLLMVLKVVVRSENRERVLKHGYGSRCPRWCFFPSSSTHSCVGLGGGGLGRRGRWGSPPSDGTVSLTPTTEVSQQSIRRCSETATTMWNMWSPERFENACIEHLDEFTCRKQVPPSYNNKQVLIHHVKVWFEQWPH